MANKKAQVRVNNGKKKRRIKIIPVIFFLIIILIVIFVFSRKITNIYVINNEYYSDQEVIELAKISNYPSIISNQPWAIKKRLEKNNLILSTKVSLKKFSQIYIEIEENYPLFYNSSSMKTTLYDGSDIEEYYSSATLINYVPDTVYPNFVDAMKKINREILQRISEIKYDPNDVDEERFLFMMDDGNYVYITLNKIENINNYINIIKNFNSKKGILYLDSGEYFKILDN